MENDLIKPSRIEEIRSRYAVNKTADDYRVMPVSEIAQMRLDIKRLLKAVDATPVVHGRWIMNSNRPDQIICMVCNVGFDVWKHEAKDFNYCPNCGAKMEGTE